MSDQIRPLLRPSTRNEALSSECEVQETDLVFSVTKEGNIECNSDSDCPPATPPSWQWNEETMIYYGVSSITEMSVYGSECNLLNVD